MDEKVIVIEEDGVKEILSISRAGKYIAELKKEIARLNVKAEGYRLDYFAANKNIDKLKAEIAELKTPDSWYDVAWDQSYESFWDLASERPLLNPFLFSSIKSLPDKWGIRFPINEDGDDDATEFDTEQEAEAFVESFKGER